MGSGDNGIGMAMVSRDKIRGVQDFDPHKLTTTFLLRSSFRVGIMCQNLARLWI